MCESGDTTANNANAIVNLCFCYARSQIAMEEEAHRERIGTLLISKASLFQNSIIIIIIISVFIYLFIDNLFLSHVV